MNLQHKGLEVYSTTTRDNHTSNQIHNVLTMGSHNHTVHDKDDIIVQEYMQMYQMKVIHLQPPLQSVQIPLKTTLLLLYCTVLPEAPKIIPHKNLLTYFVH